MRTATLAAGAKALGALLVCVGRGRQTSPLVCVCGARMKSKGLRRKELVTILGPTEYRRSMYECPACGRARYPGDEELDVEGTTRSPGLRRMMARAGGRQTFKEASQDLLIYAGITVSPKDVERVSEKIGKQMEQWSAQERGELMRQVELSCSSRQQTIPILYISCDGTGVPMIPRELEGRKGKQLDGSAKSREAKLGCLFTQIAADENERPVRDPDSTSFVAAIETAETFGERLFAEAVRRGLYLAQKVVFLGDGAKWIRGLVEMHFPMAVFIIDLYHAKEHISNLCKILFGSDEKRLISQRISWWTDLDDGNIEKIVGEAASMLPEATESEEKAQREINYFEENKERMRYAHFRKQGFFVGSGVVEAGCKSIVGSRLKQSGMEWSVAGANAILSLRCHCLSNRMEDFWESRCA
jgi:hypothetical protein